MEPYLYDQYQRNHLGVSSISQVFEVALSTLQKQLANNKVLGFTATVSHNQSLSVNGSISAKALEHWRIYGGQLPTANDGEPGFYGKLWIRLDHELQSKGPSLQQLLEPAMIRVGAGGYSTYGGPWNEFGKDIESLNVGVPWPQKGRLAAYAYDIHFFIDDILNLSEVEIMMKLKDETWKPKYKFEWVVDGQEYRDREIIDKLYRFHRQD